MSRHPRHAAKRARRRWRRALLTPRAMGRALWARAWSRLPTRQRRVRALLGAAVAFAAIVILTSFPFSEVLSQRAAIAGTASQLSSMQAANRELSAQANALKDASTIESLARHDYGFVTTGSRAYDILPPPGSSDPSSTSSGYVPLDAPPVVPGSARSQALLGVDTPATAAGGEGSSHTVSGAGSERADSAVSVPSGPPPGYWSRVLSSLEFWH